MLNHWYNIHIHSSAGSQANLKILCCAAALFVGDFNCFAWYIHAMIDNRGILNQCFPQPFNHFAFNLSTRFFSDQEVMFTLWSHYSIQFGVPDIDFILITTVCWYKIPQSTESMMAVYWNCIFHFISNNFYFATHKVFKPEQVYKFCGCWSECKPKFTLHLDKWLRSIPTHQLSISFLMVQ